MDWSATHAGFVIASYVISAVCVAGLIAYVLGRDTRAKKALAKTEKSNRG
jgi:heme exporter protein CcmD